MSGACIVDAASQWDVVVMSARIPMYDASGAPWDGFGGLPDPYARVSAAEGTATYVGQTPVAANTLVPSWAARVLSAVPASALRGGITFRFFDDDAAIDDDINACLVVVDDSLFRPGPLAFRCPEDTDPPRVAVDFVFQLEPHAP